MKIKIKIEKPQKRKSELRYMQDIVQRYEAGEGKGKAKGKEKGTKATELKQSDAIDLWQRNQNRTKRNRVKFKLNF